MLVYQRVNAIELTSGYKLDDLSLAVFSANSPSGGIPAKISQNYLNDPPSVLSIDWLKGKITGKSDFMGNSMVSYRFSNKSTH